MVKQTYRLRQQRLHKGLTQVELAALVGLKVDTLSKLERNEQEEWPRKQIRVLMNIARALECNPLELYNELIWKEDTNEQQ